MNNTLVKLSYQEAIDASFEELDETVYAYHDICSELESLGQQSIDELIQEAMSQDIGRRLSALTILGRNHTPFILEKLVDIVNSEDFSISHSAGAALISLKPEPKNLDSLLLGINKTESFGQGYLKVAYTKWSKGENIESIVQLIDEDKFEMDGSMILETLVIQRKQAYLRIFELFLKHRNEQIQVVAIAGLILLGRIEYRTKLIDLAQTKRGKTKDLAYNWMSNLMLPDFVPILLRGQTEKSAKFRLDNVVRLGHIGINQSIEILLEEMRKSNRGYAEHLGDMLNKIAGKRLYPNSFETIRKECLSIISERRPNKRYLGQNLLTPEGIIHNLPKRPDLFWQLLSMTGESFGFDPNLEPLNNWESIRKWREWGAKNNHLFEPGAFYFLGKKMVYGE